MHHVWKLNIIFTLGFILTAPITLNASPSYRCDGRLTANEALICKNDVLGDLDRDIADMFHSLTALLNRGAADFVRFDQKNFVKDRQKCGRKFRCTRNIMQARLNELTSNFNEQQNFRNGAKNDELLNEEEDGDICGPGFTQKLGKCIHNADLEQAAIVGNTRPLPSGRYGIYVLSHEDSLRLGATADKLLYTEGKSGDRNAKKQSFFVVYLNGSYTISDQKSGLRLHADDNGGDSQVSVRYQPRDDFTKFRISPAFDGCFYVQTVSSGKYWLWEPNSQVIVTRSKRPGEEGMFCFVAQ